MDNAVDDLTEKEKEALRLLFAGHDAKSSARELGISHHTVNDRLRSARRKLGVSTSREAARMLGEVEQMIPKTLVHTPLGSASAQGEAHLSSSADEYLDSTRWGWRGKGLMIMSLIAAAALAAALLTNTVPEVSDHPVETTSEPTNPKSGLEARIAAAKSLGEARAFLSLLDNGDARASYAETAGELRKNQGFQLWELGVALRNNRANFGTRKIVGAGGREGEPKPGEPVREVFIFSSKDADRTLTEFIVTEQVGADWKIVEYDLRGLDDEDEE